MTLTVELSPDELLERSADNRGRITLGSDYANQDVTLLLVEVEENG